MISQLLIIVNGVEIKLDIHVLAITDKKDGYPMILGRPWLIGVKAINYWSRGFMRIGEHPHRINVQVIHDKNGKRRISSP